MSTVLIWCTTWEGGSKESLRGFGEGLDEVGRMDRKEARHKEVEVGFGSTALCFPLFGPSRDLRWAGEWERQKTRCLIRKDGRLVKGERPPTSPPFLTTSCLFYSRGRGR